MKRQKQWVTFSLARYSAFRYPLPLGSAFGSEKMASKILDAKMRKKSWFRKKSGLSGCGGRTRTYGLRVMRQSQAQIGVISAPICAFYRRSLGEFSVVSVRPCPLFSDSGSKVGQAQSSEYRWPPEQNWLTIERGSPGRKLFGLFSYIPKWR